MNTVEEATALIVVCLGSVPHMVDKGYMCANYGQRKCQLYLSVREHAHKSQPFQKLNCGVEFRHARETCASLHVHVCSMWFLKIVNEWECT